MAFMQRLISISFLLSACFLVTVARDLEEDHAYIAPDNNDKRSPCPAINVLANHGYINRDGANVEINDLAAALAEVFPVTKEFPFLPLKGAINAGLVDTQKDGTRTLTLDRLSEPKQQEHDASFTRLDSHFGAEKASLVNMDLMTQLFTQDSETFLDRNAIKEFQAARVRDSLENNPEVSFSDGNIKAMAQQATRVIAFGQDHEYEYVEKSIVRAILQDEKLPVGYAIDPDFEKVSFVQNSKSAAVRDELEESIRQDECRV